MNQHLFHLAEAPTTRTKWDYVWCWQGSKGLPIEWEAWFGNPEVNEFHRRDISRFLSERIEHEKVVGRFLLVNGLEIEVARPLEYTQYFQKKAMYLEQLKKLL
jgi:hypothetical protein